MSEFSTPFSVDVLAFKSLSRLTPELAFGDLADLDDNGPFVYVHVAPRGGIVYYGKSDATTRAAGARAMAYAKWMSDYAADVAKSGRPDPMYDAVTGDLDVAQWAPIIRFASRHAVIVKVAPVSHTGVTAQVWEARLKALSGILTGLESVVGASGWEAKPGTLRAAAYEWAIQRLGEIRS
jgi:hypothetical protein